MATPVCNQVHVRVPATSANLGSGFDAVGLAFDFFDELTFTLKDDRNDVSAEVIIHGEGETTLPRDETHLVVSTFRKACKTFGLPKLGCVIEAYNAIPQARGMGSSAEAIVAGIAAAAAFAQEGELNRDSIFELAAAIEGHPDNVAPAVFGGLTVSWDLKTPEGVESVGIAQGEPLHSGFHTVKYAVDNSISAAIFVPDFELSTQQAREALPSQVPYADAIFNLSRVALLPAAMDSSVLDPNALLFCATQDKLHQPYRKNLMSASWELIEELRSAGFAAAVSGAGPCVLVLHHGDAHDVLERVAERQLASGHWKVLHLAVNHGGVEITR